jgi:hypothetical protein
MGLGANICELWSAGCSRHLLMLHRMQPFTLSPATRAGGKVSLIARVKALSRTFLQVASLRWGASVPSRTVVFARIEGSSSTCSRVEWAARACMPACVRVGAPACGQINSAFSLPPRRLPPPIVCSHRFHASGQNLPSTPAAWPGT